LDFQVRAGGRSGRARGHGDALAVQRREGRSGTSSKKASTQSFIISKQRG